MVREQEWRRACRSHGLVALPSYDEYLDNGLNSIGGPPHIWSDLITIGDASTPDHLDGLRPMERIASTCIRLANDLQSYRKEVAEGNINALVILSRMFESQGMSPADAYQQAETHVRDEILGRE